MDTDGHFPPIIYNFVPEQKIRLNIIGVSWLLNAETICIFDFESDSISELFQIQILTARQESNYMSY